MDLSRTAGIFSQLNQETSEFLFDKLREFSVYRYPKGKIIQFPGDDSSNLYLISRGKIKMFLYSDTEQVKTIATIGEGLFLGLQDIFHQFSTMGGQALEDSEALRIPKSSLILIFRESIELMEWLAISMSYMIHDGLGEMSVQRAENRILQYFKWLSREKGLLGEIGSIEIEHPRSVSEIARLLMMSREATSRIITSLGKKEILVLEDKKLRIPSMEKFISRVSSIPIGLGYLGSED